MPGATSNAEVAKRRELPWEMKGRRGWPETVVCYLGPTNSGKTYRALDFLAERGTGCYAGPLRMLAWEVRDDLRAKLLAKAIRRRREAREQAGENVDTDDSDNDEEELTEERGDMPAVGLWTGEEAQGVDQAAILACTAEVAPTSGDTLVLDEVRRYSA